MDYRQLVRMLAAGRVALGSTAMIAPGFVGSTWVGASAKTPEAKVLCRALAGRDLALGVGTLRALENGESVRGWATLSAFADAVDCAATMITVRKLGFARALPVIAVAGIAATAGFIATGHLD